MSGETPEKGDTGEPSGKVVETKDEGEIAIKSKKGNTIKKNASPENPAVHIGGGSSNDVVKRASEVEVQDKAATNGDKKREREEDVEEAVEEEVQEPKKAKPTKKEPKAKEDKKATKKEEKAAEKKETKKETKKQEKKKEDEMVDTEKDKEEKKEPTKETTNGEPAAKKARGRPKKGGDSGAAAAASAPPAKKERKAPSAEGIGSRTRSRAKA